MNIYETEKTNHGAFWATNYNAATNNLLNVVQFISGERRSVDQRTPQIGMMNLEDEWLDGGYARIEESAAVKLLMEPSTDANRPRQEATMKMFIKFLPFLGVIHDYYQQKEREDALKKEKFKTFNEFNAKTGARMNSRMDTRTDTYTNTCTDSRSQYQKFACDFLSIAHFLYELRNYFTHVNHDLPEKCHMSVSHPGIIFEACVRAVKERFYKSDGVSDARFESFRRYKGVERRPDPDGNDIPRKNPFYRFGFWKNDDRILKLSREIRSIEEIGTDDSDPNYDNRVAQRQQLIDNDEMTVAGLAFFASLFLEKKFVSIMLDSMKMESGDGTVETLISLFGVKNTDEMNQLVKRVFNIYNVRLPKTRLASETILTKPVLGMDMLNQLHQCPDLLFEQLSPKDQERFRTLSEDGNQEVLMKRFDDRFPYLALSYFDRQECFSQLRFCIDMGNFFFRCHRRPVIDGSIIQDRRLKKKLLWYTRYTNAVEYYQQNLRAEGSMYHVGEEFNQPPATYRSNMFPRYHFLDHQIGLRILPQPEMEFEHPWLDPHGQLKPRPKQPIVLDEQNLQEHSLNTRNENTQGENEKEAFPHPDIWLSQYELPTILFLITRATDPNAMAESVQKIITDYNEKWRTFLGHVANLDKGSLRKLKWSSGQQSLEQYKQEFYQQWGIQFMDLPDEFRYCLQFGKVKPTYLQVINEQTSPISADQVAENWLQDEHDRTMRMLQGFDNENNYDFKLGKREQPKYTNGYIARWLVRDFIRLQPCRKNDKHFGKIKSSPDYTALMTALTCYGTNRDRLASILEGAKLLRSADLRHIPHPFLGAVVKELRSLPTLESFFKRYLRERDKWLQVVELKDLYPLRKLYSRQELKAKTSNGQVAQYDYLGQIAKKLLAEPINLPRGLFEPLLRKLVTEAFPQQMADQMPEGRDVNATWLMKKYLELSNDRIQWFYSLPRSADAKPFKPLFTLLGDCAPRYDKQGQARLEEVLELTRSQRQRDIEDSVKRDLTYKKMPFREKQEYLDKRFEEEDARYGRLLSQYGEAEKDLRHIQIEDIALQGAIPHLLEIPGNKILLCNIAQQTNKKEDERSYLNQIGLMEADVTLQGGIHMTLIGKMKVKNFGNFNRMLCDIRLPSYLRLIHECGETIVDYNQLEQEFTRYDQEIRPVIFQWVYELEQTVLDRMNLKPKKGEHHIGFWEIVKQLDMSTNDKVVLAILRNAFAHQFYPEFQPLGKDKDDKSYVQFLDGIRARVLELYRQNQAKFSRTASNELVYLGPMSAAVYAFAAERFKEALSKARQ